MITDRLELQRLLLQRLDGAAWKAYLAACSADYKRRERQYARLTEAFRRAIGNADPRIGCEPMTFHLAHNWGNEAARALLHRKDAAWVRLSARHDCANLRRDQLWAGAAPSCYAIQITSRTWIIERNPDRLAHELRTLQRDGIPVLAVKVQAA